MNTEFSVLDTTLKLVRYPSEHQHKSLQAWDSADELLIEYMADAAPVQVSAPLLILNDDFGALGCWFAGHSDAAVHWYSDSWIGHRSLAVNLQANQMPVTFSDDYLVEAPVKAHSALHTLPATPDTVLIKIPRTQALLEAQLQALSHIITPQTRIVAAAKVKMVTKSVLGLFEKYLGVTTTSLAKKKSRLIFCEPQQPVRLPHSQTAPTMIWEQKSSNGKSMQVHNLANVFSRQSLDIGARLMLEHMHVTNHEQVIDLGCGNGILGLNALALAPEANITFVDESFMALESARMNVAHNFPDAQDNCHFVASNCLEQLLGQGQQNQYDKVLCNPPFHQQNAITDHIAWQMFHDSRDALRRGGHLIVVANRHLEYHIKLKRLFGGVKVLASNRKFVILSSAKR